MNIQMMEVTEELYHVVFSHPEYGTERHDVAVNSDHNIFDDEEHDEYINKLLDMIQQKFDPYHFYHEMEVTQQYVIDGKVYIAQIKRKAGIDYV